MRFTLAAFLLAFASSTVFAADNTGLPVLKVSRLKRTPTEALENAQKALKGPLINASLEELQAETAIQARETFDPSRTISASDQVDGMGVGKVTTNNVVTGTTIPTNINRWYSPTSGLIKLSQVDIANKDKRLKTADERKLNKIFNALGADNDEDKMRTTFSNLASLDDKGFPKTLYYISEAQRRLTYGPEYAQKIFGAESDIRIARSAMAGDYQRSAEDPSSEYAKLLSSLGLTFENKENNLLSSLEAIRSFMNHTISERSILDFSSFKPKNPNFNIAAPSNKDLKELKAHALENTRYAGDFGLSNPYERLKVSFPKLYNNPFAPTATTAINEANLKAARQYLQKKGKRPKQAANVETLDDAFNLLNKFFVEEVIVEEDAD